MTLLEYFEELQPVPQYAQIATGGNWEEAIRIDFNQEDQIVLPRADNVDPSVAGEIFYKLSDGRMLFVGLRYSSELTEAPAPDIFLQKLEAVIKTAGQISLRDTLGKLGDNLNGNPNTYLAETVDYVELGVEGYWKSMGSMKLRERDEPTLTLPLLAELLNQNQNLVNNSKNHTALEFATKKPEHWFGLQVSHKAGGKFVTDMKSLTELVNLI